MPILTDTKTEKVAGLIREFYQKPIRDLLVVGCGSGIEAAILAQRLEANVVGVDLQERFDHEALQHCDLRKGDAMSLDLDARQFDFVFSYHALEHIDDPMVALREMRRVLRDGGGFWIGTPNKSRLIGYVGGKNTSLSEKLRWNIADWRARMSGRFENRLGAHAGFTRAELRGMLSPVFSRVDDRTSDYFSSVYQSHRPLIRFIDSSGLSDRLYPSVYFSGLK